MSREKKKGTVGTAKTYMSRGKAMKKLQLTLSEFRRLCILKGIHPRDPRKKLEGSDKTYYLTKDIAYLAHDPLIKQIREKNAMNKKLIKARSKKRLDLLKKLSLQSKKYNYNHLIIERYPNFNDVLMDLDDPLCIISLFANLPSHQFINLSANNVSKAQTLLSEFMYFVTKQKCLTKSFVSIKGYYFQAEINGIQINWITPHRFTPLISKDIDFSVMKTFLDLYLTILKFVNFRLFTQNNLAYPPKIDRRVDSTGRYLDSLIVETKENAINHQSGPDTVSEKDAVVQQGHVTKDVVRQAELIAKRAVAEVNEDDDEGEDDDDEGSDNRAEEENMEVDGGGEGSEEDNNDKEGSDDEEKEHQGSKDDNANEVEIDQEIKDMDNNDDDDAANERKGVFNGKSVILGREVPFYELEFVLKSTGASKVTREDDLPTSPAKSWSESGYSHWIIDRPAVAGKRDMGLEYVQPQYVFDSVNSNILLPVELYGVGKPLPPHLSPFVSSNDEDGGYRPWYEQIIERIKRGDETVIAEAATVVYNENEAGGKETEGEGANAEERSGTDAEVKDEGVNDEGDEEVDSEGEDEKVEVETKEKTEKEEKEMAALMLSRRKKRQYKRVKGAELMKEAKKQKLEHKRRKIEQSN